MDGPRGYYAKWNKSDRERQILYAFTHMWHIKKNQTRQKQRHRYKEQSSGYQRGKGEGEGKMGKGDQLYGDGWKLNFWWPACWGYTEGENIMLYTWNI